MEQEAAVAEVRRLEALGAGDPRGVGFAALAEAERRAGRPDEALRIADRGLCEQPQLVAGRVARSLALLDLGRPDEARDELLAVLGAVPDHPIGLRALEDTGASRAGAGGPFDDLGEAELETAFEEAEASPEEMLDANHVAEAVLRSVDDGVPEGIPVEDDSPFATETVAGLLERQGHEREARAVRDVISRRREGPRPSLGDRARMIATLEGWLENIRRGSR